MSAINYYKTPARDKILSSRGDIIFANKSQVSLRLRGGSYNNTCNWPFYNDARLRFAVTASPGFAIAHRVLRIRVLLCGDGQFLGKFKRKGERHFQSHDFNSTLTWLLEKHEHKKSAPF